MILDEYVLVSSCVAVHLPEILMPDGSALCGTRFKSQQVPNLNFPSHAQENERLCFHHREAASVPRCDKQMSCRDALTSTVRVVSSHISGVSVRETVWRKRYEGFQHCSLAMYCSLGQFALLMAEGVDKLVGVTYVILRLRV